MPPRRHRISLPCSSRHATLPPAPCGCLPLLSRPASLPPRRTCFKSVTPRQICHCGKNYRPAFEKAVAFHGTRDKIPAQMKSTYIASSRRKGEGTTPYKSDNGHSRPSETLHKSIFVHPGRLFLSPPGSAAGGSNAVRMSLRYNLSIRKRTETEEVPSGFETFALTT